MVPDLTMVLNTIPMSNLTMVPNLTMMFNILMPRSDRDFITELPEMLAGVGVPG